MLDAFGSMLTGRSRVSSKHPKLLHDGVFVGTISNPRWLSAFAHPIFVDQGACTHKVPEETLGLPRGFLGPQERLETETCDWDSNLGPCGVVVHMRQMIGGRHLGL